MRYAIAAALAVAGFWAAVPARGVVLYDASVDTAPQSDGYLSYFGERGGIPGVYYTSAAGTPAVLSTVAPDAQVRAGWSNHTILGQPLPTPAGGTPFPSLDPNVGFTLTFDVAVTQDTNTADRTGFSVILLGSDHEGVELAFGQSQVWAYDAAFTHAPSQTHAITASATPVRYTLTVNGNAYTLSSQADGQLLSGAVRDYSAFLPTTPDPYELPSYVFFGDDSTSAGAVTAFRYAAIEVPEPGALAVLSLPLAALLVRRRKQTAAR